LDSDRSYTVEFNSTSCPYYYFKSAVRADDIVDFVIQVEAKNPPANFLIYYSTSSDFRYASADNYKLKNLGECTEEDPTVSISERARPPVTVYWSISAPSYTGEFILKPYIHESSEVNFLGVLFGVVIIILVVAVGLWCLISIIKAVVRNVRRR